MNNHEQKSSFSDKAGPIIIKALNQYLEELKNTIHDDVLVPPELLVGVDGNSVTQTDAVSQWINIIERMIYAFNDNVSVDEFGAIWEEGEDGKIVISNKVKFKKFERAQLEHEAKVKAGMRLFVKHYEFL